MGCVAPFKSFERAFAFMCGQFALFESSLQSLTRIRCVEITICKAFAGVFCAYLLDIFNRLFSGSSLDGK